MSNAILAWGGGSEACSSQATIDYMKGLGFSEFQYVSADLNPRKDICDRLIANGIFPVYDVEGALWAGTYSAASILWAVPQLNAIKAAGWKGFSSEGMFGPNVEILRNILPYCNYGGENGEQMLGGYYGHWAGQHTANYMECYHKSALGHGDVILDIERDTMELPLKTYRSTLLGNKADTPNEMGLTWMMYPATADLEMDTAAMKAFLDWGEQQGVKWKAFLFWMGMVQCPSDKLKDGTFMPLLNMVKSKFTVVKRTAWNQGDTPVPPPPPPAAADGPQPATCVGPDGTLYMFARGTDNALWYRTPTVSWKSLGGILTSGPAAATVGNDVYIVVRGMEKITFFRTLTNTWVNIGGISTSAPAATSNGTKLEVFVRGSDKHLYQKTYDSVTKTWTAWKNLGGIIN